MKLIIMVRNEKKELETNKKFSILNEKAIVNKHLAKAQNSELLF